MPPSAPPPLSPGLRLASPNDVLRIGIVAASGFRYHSEFEWKHPYHERHPSDTLLSYRQAVSSAMKDERCIVLVALDRFDPREHEMHQSKAIISQDHGWKPPAAGEEVVVGVGCWRLAPDSGRIGGFQNETGPYPLLPPNLDRDKEPKRTKAYDQGHEAAEKEYLDGYFMMDMLVVHPKYWRRGHGTRLAQWGLDLARMDGVNLGVISGIHANLFYTSLQVEFTTRGDVHVEGDEMMEEGVTLSVMEFGRVN